MLFSGADAVANLAAVAAGLARPLQPELGDSAATFAGPSLLALLAAAPSAIAPAIPSLLSALAGGPALPRESVEDGAQSPQRPLSLPCCSCWL